MIMQFGIRTVTMDDIAKHLSISKKTIYLYFKDKRELVNTITEAHLATEEVRFEDVVNTLNQYLVIGLMIVLTL